MVSLAGGDLRRVTNDEGDESSVEWSPDGELFVFTSNRAGNPDVWTVPVEGSSPTSLTSGAGNDTQPQWSPNGAWIAFHSILDDQSDIWVVSASGGPARRVTDDTAGILVVPNIGSWFFLV